MKKSRLIYYGFVVILLSGCSYTLHERKADPENKKDHGSKTELQLRGPKAKVSHQF
jgi:hypothetical protein